MAYLGEAPNPTLRGLAKKDSFTGDGSTTTLTINSGRSVSDVVVDVNGVIMTPTTDYTISGTTLTLAGGAPPAGSNIVVRYLPLTG